MSLRDGFPMCQVPQLVSEVRDVYSLINHSVSTPSNYTGNRLHETFKKTVQYKLAAKMFGLCYRVKNYKPI